MSLEDLTPDQLLAKAREFEPAHNLVQTLSKDPEARNLFQRYLKKKNPQLAIPELDTEDRIVKRLDEEKASREKFETEVREREISERLSREKARVKEKYHLTDEDMKGVEALMVKSDTNPEPIPYYDAAARLFQAARAPAVPTPSSYSPPTYSMPEKEVWSKGIGSPANLNRIAMEQAYAAFNDIKSGKVGGNA